MMKKLQILPTAGNWVWHAYGIAYLHEHIYWSSYVHPCLSKMVKNTMFAGTCTAETASVWLPIL